MGSHSNFACRSLNDYYSSSDNRSIMSSVAIEKLCEVTEINPDDAIVMISDMWAQDYNSCQEASVSERGCGSLRDTGTTLRSVVFLELDPNQIKVRICIGYNCNACQEFKVFTDWYWLFSLYRLSRLYCRKVTLKSI